MSYITIKISYPVPVSLRCYECSGLDMYGGYCRHFAEEVEGSDDRTPCKSCLEAREEAKKLMCQAYKE